MQHKRFWERERGNARLVVSPLLYTRKLRKSITMSYCTSIPVYQRSVSKTGGAARGEHGVTDRLHFTVV